MPKRIFPFLLLAGLLAGCPNTGSNNTIQNLTIESVALNKTTLTLNAKPTTGSISEGYVVSEQLIASVKASDNGTHSVTWATSDPTRVTVDKGLVTTLANAPEGPVTITATSVDDPSKSASAIVTITRIGDANLGIE